MVTVSDLQPHVENSLRLIPLSLPRTPCWLVFLALLVTPATFAQGTANEGQTHAEQELASFEAWAQSQAAETVKSRVKDKAWDIAINNVIGPAIGGLQSGIAPYVSLDAVRRLGLSGLDPSASAARLASVDFGKILGAIEIIDRINAGEVSAVIKEAATAAILNAVTSSFPVLGQLKSAYDLAKTAYDYFDNAIYEINVKSIYEKTKDLTRKGCQDDIWDHALDSRGSVRSFIIGFGGRNGVELTSTEVDDHANSARTVVAMVCQIFEQRASSERALASAAQSAKQQIAGELPAALLAKHRDAVNTAYEKELADALRGAYEQERLTFEARRKPIEVPKPASPPASPPVSSAPGAPSPP